MSAMTAEIPICPVCGQRAQRNQHCFYGSTDAIQWCHARGEAILVPGYDLVLELDEQIRRQQP